MGPASPPAAAAPTVAGSRRAFHLGYSTQADPVVLRHAATLCRPAPEMHAGSTVAPVERWRIAPRLVHTQELLRSLLVDGTRGSAIADRPLLVSRQTLCRPDQAPCAPLRTDTVQTPTFAPGTIHLRSIGATSPGPTQQRLGASLCQPHHGLCAEPCHCRYQGQEPALPLAADLSIRRPQPPHGDTSFVHAHSLDRGPMISHCLVGRVSIATQAARGCRSAQLCASQRIKVSLGARMVIPAHGQRCRQREPGAGGGRQRYGGHDAHP